MKKYGYVGDPVCVIACACYAANRWGLPLALKGPFLRNYFDDVFLIPAALPVVLWLQRRLQLRTSDNRPNWREVILHLVIWSVAAEVIGPYLFAQAKGDVWDVAAYTAGAAVATAVWSIG